ncbi:MAG TPA: cytochrome c oxidase subunit II [Opitutaceae bacterium]|nr:cytochrome c oxidase subunit II [Opitutaceae bacterium]
MKFSSSAFPRSRWVSFALALAGIVLLPGCWWEMNGHQSTIDVEGPVARDQLQVFYTTCWVTLVIFLLVGSALAYATLKFRARTKADEDAAPPEQSHGNPFVEIGLIGASVFALVIIAVPTLRAIWYDYDVPAMEKANAYSINATGFQWWWKFEYPNEQTEPDSTGTRGLVTTANELVIPAGRPIHIELRTMDVIHSFWVPKLAGKVDMMPNRGNRMWLEADHPGYYWGQCAQYCGDSHAVMRFRVIALDAKDFADWLANQKKTARVVSVAQDEKIEKARPVFASWKQNQTGFVTGDQLDISPLDAWRAKQFPEKEEDPALIAQGRHLFQVKTCAGCHNVRGHEGVGIAYPDLTHVGARTTIAGSLLENNTENLTRWITNPGAVKPGNKMWVEGYLKNNIHLTPDDVAALVAYVQSLK